jgi:hypothetical protein
VCATPDQPTRKEGTVPPTKQPETRASTYVRMNRRRGHAEMTTRYAPAARERRKAARRAWAWPAGPGGRDLHRQASERCHRERAAR